MQATIVPTRVLPTEENGNGLATNAIQCLLSLFLPDASYPLYYIPFYAMLKAERHGPARVHPLLQIQRGSSRMSPTRKFDRHASRGVFVRISVLEFL